MKTIKLEHSWSQLPDKNFTGIAKWPNGEKAWFLNGKYHRTNGPAVVNGRGRGRGWYINGKPHRIDGPAILVPGVYESYYFNGVETTKEGLRLIVDIMKARGTDINKLVCE